MIPCYICYSETDDEFICDMCNRHYCEGCSYTFSIHYQHEGGRCYWCSEQGRLKTLTRETIRDNKIKYLLTLTKN
jgi:hypothetical protein